MAERLNVLVDGGKATPGPPLGPALGPLGVNIVEILKAINEKTKSFEGMKVPVTLLVDPKTKAFTIEVGTPPTSALIAKELKIEKGSGDAGKTRVGNLSLAQAIKVANMKADAMQGKSLKARVLEVVGTAVSMGATVEGEPSKELSKDIHSGQFDRHITGVVRPRRPLSSAKSDRFDSFRTTRTRRRERPSASNKRWRISAATGNGLTQRIWPLLERITSRSLRPIDSAPL